VSRRIQDRNEMGIFQTAAGALLEAYPNRFDVIMYDSGACSLENATWIKDQRLDYVFCLTANQPTLLEEAVRCLGANESHAGPEETAIEGSNVVVRRLFLHQVSEKGDEKGFLDWTHLRTIIRLEKTITDKVLNTTTVENRYYLTSLSMDALTSSQWLDLIRRRWSVENENHCTWDKYMHEDDRPWILDPAGMVNVMLLRRIAYNILTIFRGVTLRSESRRAVPWTDLFKCVDLAMKVATIEMLSGIRRRPLATP
jgi:predicted transposase YbfD/YdcC